MQTTNQRTIIVLKDAAAKWKDELEEYVIPASENCDDPESAAGQRNEVSDIQAALEHDFESKDSTQAEQDLDFICLAARDFMGPYRSRSRCPIRAQQRP